MKLLHLTLAIGLTTALAACDQLQNTSRNTASAPAAKDTSAVVATVNGTPITEAVLDLYENQLKGRQLNGQMNRKAVLDEVINLELASQSGAKDGLANQLQTQLQVDQQRRAVIASAAIHQFLESHPISDEDMHKVYDQQVPKGNEYKARHILVADEAKANELIKELDKGADFSELAKKFSTGPSGKSGGELGWFSPKQMVAPFSEAAAKLEKGKYTEKPVKTQFGWHIIMLDDERETVPPGFDQVKPQLQAFMQKQRVQEYIDGLRKTAKIEIKEAAVAATPAPDAAAETAPDAEDASAAAPATPEDAASGDKAAE